MQTNDADFMEEAEFSAKITVPAQEGAHHRKSCLDDSPAATLAYGSRINVAVDPGTYYLVVDGFDATQFGPFTLQVKVSPNGCVPNCDGQLYGGDDGLRCLPDPCTPAASALDYQRLDVTDVPPGDYFLEVVLNPSHAFQEVSFDNNTARVPVTIP